MLIFIATYASENSSGSNETPYEFVATPDDIVLGVTTNFTREWIDRMTRLAFADMSETDPDAPAWTRVPLDQPLPDDIDLNPKISISRNSLVCEFEYPGPCMPDRMSELAVAFHVFDTDDNALPDIAPLIPA